MPPHEVEVDDENHTVTIRLDGQTATVSAGAEGRFRITLDGASAAARMGGMESSGSFRLDNGSGRRRVTLDAADASFRLQLAPEPGGLTTPDPAGPVTIELAGDEGRAVFGGIGQAGQLIVTTDDGAPTIELSGDGPAATLRVGNANGQFGKVVLEDRTGVTRVSLDGQSGELTGERLRVRNVTVIDDGGSPRIGMQGEGSTLTVGFRGEPGNVVVRNEDQEEGVRLTGRGRVLVGGDGQSGMLTVHKADGIETIRAEGNTGRLVVDQLVTNNGVMIHGDLSLFDSDGSRTVWLAPNRGTALLGGNGINGDVAVFRASTSNPSDLDDAMIHLNGQTGDIVLQNADCAEEFEVSRDGPVDPGALVVIGQEGVLELSTTAYDTRVAGIVAGGGGHAPGIILGRTRGAARRLPIALAGTVRCKVDARYGAIEVGDLLSSSDTPGHAMKASDRSRAAGAIVGKALGRLTTGTGLVRVLVALA